MNLVRNWNRQQAAKEAAISALNLKDEALSHAANLWRAQIAQFLCMHGFEYVHGRQLGGIAQFMFKKSNLAVPISGPLYIFKTIHCTFAAISIQAEHKLNFIFLFKSTVILPSDIETEAIPLGLIGRRVANKGAIVLKMRIGRASCAFITSHLKAGQTSIAGRNKDIDHVLSQLHFTHSDMDCLFWFGDLNYR